MHFVSFTGWGFDVSDDVVLCYHGRGGTED